MSLNLITALKQNYKRLSARTKEGCFSLKLLLLSCANKVTYLLPQILEIKIRSLITPVIASGRMESGAIQRFQFSLVTRFLLGKDFLTQVNFNRITLVIRLILVLGTVGSLLQRQWKFPGRSKALQRDLDFRYCSLILETVGN